MHSLVHKYFPPGTLTSVFSGLKTTLCQVWDFVGFFLLFAVFVQILQKKPLKMCKNENLENNEKL
jgi:hypothetical protein